MFLVLATIIAAVSVFTRLLVTMGGCSGGRTPRGGIVGLRGCVVEGTQVSRVVVGYIPHIQRRVLLVPCLPPVLVRSFLFGGGCIDFVILICFPLMTNEDECLLLLDSLILNIVF